MEIVLQNAHARAVIPKKGFRKGSLRLGPGQGQGTVCAFDQLKNS